MIQRPYHGIDELRLIYMPPRELYMKVNVYKIYGKLVRISLYIFM